MNGTLLITDDKGALSATRRAQDLRSDARRIVRLSDPPASPEGRANFAITSGDIAALLLPGLKTAFFETFGITPSQWDTIATVINSDKDTENYAWLGALPGMREWTDERQPGDMTPYTYQIKNKKFESTIAVDRTAIEDDLYGQIALRIRQMAQSAKQDLDRIVFGLLGGGFVNLCYDSAPFFGTHTQGGFPQNNKSTDALSVAGLQNAITAMMRFLDDKGRPAGTVPTMLVVPPELTWEAWSLLNSSFFPDPVTSANQNLSANPLKGMLSLVTTPFLSNTADWYLLDTKRVLKAIVLQMRTDFEFSALEGNTETGFLRDQYLYGVRARYNAGYGDWRAAFGAMAG